jgi:predicted NodU family carbamoyl transferase
MRVLGLSGLFAVEADPYPLNAELGFFHDAAAALVLDGEPAVAVEEERVNREKHTNKFPAAAIRSCLKVADVDAASIERVAYFFDEWFVDDELHRLGLASPDQPIRRARAVLAERVGAALSRQFDESRIEFVQHHLAHASSAYFDSGFDDGLVVVMDGNGERHGISVYSGESNRLQLLQTYDAQDSLGHYYTALTEFLGYGKFDEYKVMGLAAYGDPAGFDELFREHVPSSPGTGQYSTDVAAIVRELREKGIRARRRGEEIGSLHADIAAAAQAALERVVLDLTSYWLVKTGHTALTLSGGVAQNTSCNGKLLGAGAAQVYLHPAVDDAGTALGAAYAVSPPTRSRGYTLSPYLGAPLGSDADLDELLATWGRYVSAEVCSDVVGAAAEDLAAGRIIGWAQGRSEFGPRALGNRSILGDPRDVENRDRVNAVVKKRESYRPLAPATTTDNARRFFEFPDGVDFNTDFMGFVCRVRDDQQAVVPAVTHIDGTARVQTVSERSNSLFWSLLRRFGDLTGVPVLLNTSFNNFAEPIVQSATDALVCYLLSHLDVLYLGDRRVVRVDADPLPRQLIADTTIRLAPFVAVDSRTTTAGERHLVWRPQGDRRQVEIGSSAAEFLARGLAASAGVAVPAGLDDGVYADLVTLWEHRLVQVEPA